MSSASSRWAGPASRRPRLLRTRLGASLDELLDGELQPGAQRVDLGLGARRPRRARREADAFLGRHHLQISVLPEGGEREMFGYIAPGAEKFSVTGTSCWAPSGARTASPSAPRTNGSPRAMVPIGSLRARDAVRHAAHLPAARADHRRRPSAPRSSARSSSTRTTSRCAPTSARARPSTGRCCARRSTASRRSSVMRWLARAARPHRHRPSRRAAGCIAGTRCGRRWTRSSTRRPSVTTTGAHVRDAIDLKRMMMTGRHRRAAVRASWRCSTPGCRPTSRIDPAKAAQLDGWRHDVIRAARSRATRRRACSPISCTARCTSCRCTS